ncbi:hypothetical protein B0H21DRAFT_793427, partial [Amylocystis lapponica]
MPRSLASSTSSGGTSTPARKPISPSSSEEYSRESTLAGVFFGLALPYRPPRSALGVFFWRRRIWLETTFALSMVEPWEKVLISDVVYASLALLLVAARLYLPRQIVFVSQRTAYYFLGSE